MQDLHRCRWYKILIPCFLPVRKIIHELKLVDYLHVQADKPWKNYYIANDKSANMKNMLTVVSSIMSFISYYPASQE